MYYIHIIHATNIYNTLYIQLYTYITCIYYLCITYVYYIYTLHIFYTYIQVYVYNTYRNHGLNYKVRNYKKILELNIREKLGDLGPGEEFLDMTPKSQSIKGKIAR